MSVHIDQTGLPRHGEAARRVLMLAAAAVAGIAIVVYGQAVEGRALLEKYPPDMSFIGWIRIALSAAVAAALVYAVSPGSVRVVRAQPSEERVAAALAWLAGIVLTGAAAIVLSIPELLNETVREGQLLGVLTDLVLAFAVVALLVAAVRSPRSCLAPVWGVRPSLAFGSMAFVVFLILMEEMSWGQHLFGWEAGTRFAGNAQNETNLHNFSTYKFEAVYYSSAFLLFVALPALWPNRPARFLAQMTHLVPPRTFAVACLPIGGLMYEEWNIVPYQVWYFASLLIGARIAVELWGDRNRAAVAALAMVVSLAVSQAIFVTFGNNLVDGYELSEIREFMIGCALAAYAGLMAGRASPVPRTAR